MLLLLHSQQGQLKNAWPGTSVMLGLQKPIYMPLTAVWSCISNEVRKNKRGAIIRMLEYAQWQFPLVCINWQHPSSWNHLMFFSSPPAIVQQDRMSYSAPVSSTDFLYSGLSSYVPWFAPLLLYTQSSFSISFRNCCDKTGEKTTWRMLHRLPS